MLDRVQRMVIGVRHGRNLIVRDRIGQIVDILEYLTGSGTRSATRCGTGDSLTNRLIESGKLRPVEIRTQNGRLVRRSLKQRAQTIARVESARIVNHTHETLATEILGDEAVYINSNPRDSRTTDICRRASARGPMTLKDWDDSNFGRPPRLRPFHMCRSVLIGGQATWFEGRAAA